MVIKKLFAKLNPQKQTSPSELFKLGVIAGLLEVVYIILVAVFMLVAQSLFPDNSASVIIGIVSFLIVFVFSAMISGVIMLSLPLYFAIHEKYKEALIVMFSSGFSLLAILIIVILGRLFL